MRKFDKLIFTSCFFMSILIQFNFASFAEGNEIVSHKIGSIIRDCTECPEIVLVPEVGHSAENPGATFFVTRFEITWKQYFASVRDTICPSPKIPPDSSDTQIAIQNKKIDDEYPVTLIPPNEFKCYLRWLKIKTSFNYRIPSSKEWEHFARAGSRNKYPWGDSIGYDNASVIERVKQAQDIKYYDTQRLIKKYNTKGYGSLALSDPRKIFQSDNIWPVGSFQPNAWGLFDVIGNAEEVTNENSSECVKLKITKFQCSFMETRGLGYLPPKRFRSQSFSLFDFRGFIHANDRSGTVGYRLVRDK